MYAVYKRDKGVTQWHIPPEDKITFCTNSKICILHQNSHCKQMHPKKSHRVPGYSKGKHTETPFSSKKEHLFFKALLNYANIKYILIHLKLQSKQGSDKN